MSEETEEKVETVSYTPKSSGGKVQYSAPCLQCGTKLNGVSVKDHKAKCPECSYENPVRHT